MGSLGKGFNDFLANEFKDIDTKSLKKEIKKEEKEEEKDILYHDMKTKFAKSADVKKIKPKPIVKEIKHSGYISGSHNIFEEIR